MDNTTKTLLEQIEEVLVLKYDFHQSSAITYAVVTVLFNCHGGWLVNHFGDHPRLAEAINPGLVRRALGCVRTRLDEFERLIAKTETGGAR